MTQREKAMIALHEFEQAMREAKCVCVAIVGVPETQEFMRLSNGMGEEGNRIAFTQTFLDYMQKHAEGAAAKE